MSFKCIIGLHTWSGCKCSCCGKIRDKNHWWKECKCSDCGKIREEHHNWKNNCEKCDRCGKTRKDQHDWKGCKCINCFQSRDEQHDWKGCTCSKCGKNRGEQHDWTGIYACTCKECNLKIHDWSENCDYCSKCHEHRFNQHIWSGYKCSKCGLLSFRIMVDIFVQSVKEGNILEVEEIIIASSDDSNRITKNDFTDENYDSLNYYSTKNYEIAYLYYVLLKISTEVKEQKNIKEISELLIKYGLNINNEISLTYTKITPLFLAYQHNLPDIVELLIDKGAQCNKDKLLLVAAGGGDRKVSMAEVLIKNNANFNSEEELNAALHDAVCEEQYNMAEFLIRQGGKLNIRYETSATALSNSGRINSKKLIQFLFKNLGESYIEQILGNLKNADEIISFSAAKILVLVGDLRGIESIFTYSISFEEEILTRFSSASEEFNSVVNNYINLFNECCAYNQKEIIIYEEREASCYVNEYSLESAQIALHKLVKIRNSISNNLLHILTKLKDKEVISRYGTFEETRYITLSFSELRDKAKKVLIERGSPSYTAAAFITKEKWVE